MKNLRAGFFSSRIILRYTRITPWWERRAAHLRAPSIWISGGRVVGWDEEKEARARKLVKRETARLRESFRQAKEAGYEKYIMFLHYPPTSILEETSPFTEIAEEYGVTAVVYSHCHGESRFGDSLRGEFHGVRYMLVSGDYLNFHPELVMK